MNITNTGANVVVNAGSVIYAQDKLPITFTVATRLESVIEQTDLG
jgi:Skp family chaperone for outer membrane proteins